MRQGPFSNIWSHFVLFITFTKQNDIKTADDKTRNSGRNLFMFLHHCDEQLYKPSGCLLNLSMDNSTILGFSYTSGDYKGLVSTYRTTYMWEMLPRLSMVRVVIAYLGLQ